MAVFKDLDLVRTQVRDQYAILIGDYGINLNQISGDANNLIFV
jgi:hypothetical protein